MGQNNKNNKKKKKKNGSKSVTTPSSGSEISSHATSSSLDNIVDTSESTFWSSTTECSYYAKLGCHIAAIARCSEEQHDKILRRSPSNNIRSKSKSRKNRLSHNSTCSYYQDMYRNALEKYPWLLGIERFDPGDYHPEDIESIPEIAMSDGGDESDDEGDSGWGTLTLTNVTKDTTNICYVTVYDVDLCGADGVLLPSGWATATSVAENSAETVDNGQNAKESVVANFSDSQSSDKPETTTVKRKCTTFIVLCPPQTFVHLCSMAPNQLQSLASAGQRIPITSWSQVEIESDVQPWSFHPNTDDEHPYLLNFPFHRSDSNENGPSPNDLTLPSSSPCYQCTQSENGQLTHFFHGNYHAIDFSCPIGTPLYSPVNGFIVEVRDYGGVSHKGGDTNVADGIDGNLENGQTPNEVIEVSGVATKNLFHWNSIMIQVSEASDQKTNSVGENEQPSTLPAVNSTDPLYVEYVHIQTNSCAVKVGDFVYKGQFICKSGSVGFSPEPHLHLAAYRSNGDDAATVRVRFEKIRSNCEAEVDSFTDGPSFFPITGGWYNENGISLTSS